MTPQLVLAAFRSLIHSGDLQPSVTMLDLVDLLSRTHGTLDDEDWDVIAAAGACMWQSQHVGEADSEAAFNQLMGRLRRGL